MDNKEKIIIEEIVVNADELNGAVFTGAELYLDVLVINETGYNLCLENHDLSWGKWVESPSTVYAYKLSSFRACGRSDSPSGTEGCVRFNLLENTDQFLKLTFDIPFNTFKSSKVNISYDLPFEVKAQSKKYGKSIILRLTFIK